METTQVAYLLSLMDMSACSDTLSPQKTITVVTERNEEYTVTSKGLFQLLLSHLVAKMFTMERPTECTTAMPTDGTSRQPFLCTNTFMALQLRNGMNVLVDRISKGEIQMSAQPWHSLLTYVFSSVPTVDQIVELDKNFYRQGLISALLCKSACLPATGYRDLIRMHGTRYWSCLEATLD